MFLSLVSNLTRANVHSSCRAENGVYAQICSFLSLLSSFLLFCAQ